MKIWFKTTIIIFLFFIVFTLGFYIGYKTTLIQNKGLYEYECSNSPTLDYEFNCNYKFRNITGVYCLDNETIKLICENKLEEK